MKLSDLRVSNIAVIAKIPQPSGKKCTFKNRSHCGLMFVESGCLYYEHNGKRYISDNSHVLFLPKHLNYSMDCIDCSMSYVINFDASNEYEDKNIQSFDMFPQPYIFNLLSKLEKAWTLKKPAFQCSCIGLVYETIARIEESKSSQVSQTYMKKKIDSSLRYIEEHYCDSNLDNDMLAAQSFVSTVYFRKLFKNIYGVSPMRYVQSLRIKRAKALLQSGYLSVTAIAETVGYSSVFHFSRLFKQIEGKSPSEYARDYMQTEN